MADPSSDDDIPRCFFGAILDLLLCDFNRGSGTQTQKQIGGEFWIHAGEDLGRRFHMPLLVET